MEATLWLVLVASGFGLLRVMTHVEHPLLDALLVRAAAFSFIGAGLVGASGWLGGAMTATVAWVNSAAAAAGAAALGTGAVWIVWAGLTLAWVLTILPESWFDVMIPDWLSVSGLVLPAMAASIPGPLGQLLRTTTTAAGQVMITATRSAVGM